MDELKKVKTTYILERREYLLVSVTETKPHSYATLSIPPSNSDFVEKKYENRYSANSICPYSIPLHQTNICPYILYQLISRKLVVIMNGWMQNSCTRIEKKILSITITLRAA